MMLTKTVIAKMERLSPECQQQVVDFIDFLLAQSPPSGANDGEAKKTESAPEPVSIFQTAGELNLIGCGEGSSDLSSNSLYLEKYGN